MRSWDANRPFPDHPLVQPLLLLAVILAVYYPALYSGVHPLDDPGIISRYSASIPFCHLLTPGSGYYYRPLLELTYWLDNLLWSMEPRTMHLENILLHCANSLLVFFLARRLGAEGMLTPLLAGLLFALHPVNVEAVAWIAGRSDLLMTLFGLLSIWFVLVWLKQTDWRALAVASVFLCAALMTKETALCLGAVLFLMIVTWQGTATGRQRAITAGVMVVTVLLLVMAGLFFLGTNNGLVRFLTSANPHLWQGINDALQACGLYAKKLLVPVPLNFAIYEISPAYRLLGLLLAPLIWWVLRCNRPAGLLLTAALLCLLPAVLVAVKQVAWTRYAERYLYLPTAFVALGLAVYKPLLPDRRVSMLRGAAWCLACIYAFVSLQRNVLWSDKLAFFEDAIEKSPRFGSVYHSLGGVLHQSGQLDRAAEAFAVADRLNQRDSMRYLIKESRMAVLLAKGEYAGVRSYFFQLFQEKQAAPPGFLELLYKADDKRLHRMNGEEKRLLALDLLDTLALLQQKRPDPFWLYQSGRYMLLTGDRARAAVFFKQTCAAAPADAHYYRAARIYLRRLEATP